MSSRHNTITGRQIIIACVLTAAATLCLTYLSCSDNTVTKPDQATPAIQLISRTDCKVDATAPPIAASSCTHDCLQYWNDSTGNLHIKHINAAFNCCMDSISLSVAYVNQVMLITEVERVEFPCRCLCLYDVEYEITNPPVGRYKIEIVEPYAAGTDDRPLCCSAILPLNDTLECCVERCHYPWGRTLKPQIEVLDRTGCKRSMVDSFNVECVQWSRNDAGVLTLKHVNALYNCCSDYVHAAIEMHGDTVLITESERGEEPCDCMCYYDLDMQITDLPLGMYYFKVIGPSYLSSGSLFWRADLSQTPTGEHCERRDLIPNDSLGGS